MVRELGHSRFRDAPVFEEDPEYVEVDEGQAKPSS